MTVFPLTDAGDLAEMLLRLTLASILGGVIGIEREIHGRPAGFRTHLLVSLGSCLFVLISISMSRMYGDFTGRIPVGVDPGRIAAQVVTGIGFLGAGAIMRQGTSVRGLTTAACLWIAAAIGMACGAGLFAVSMAVTLIAVASLLLLKKVEAAISRDSYSYLGIRASDGSAIEAIERIIATFGITVAEVTRETNHSDGTVFIEMSVVVPTKRRSGRMLVHELAALKGVDRVSLSQVPGHEEEPSA